MDADVNYTVINPRLLDQGIYFEGIAALRISEAFDKSPVLSMLTGQARDAIARIAASGLTVPKDFS